ncbi:HEXXH motif domain-containing protein [Streptomyces sp. NBC_01477]|uniref:HEXXH motif domain-containing protein n=1 Tax=Streptomyces sp. NBC_01477 TaxID=2976015 RepID=UPI002E2F0C08|nr:HEXXH motif domain-containing protein [Streptomyces sp. NBC_01477]
MSGSDVAGRSAIKPHVVTAAMFARLAAGGGGAEGARLLVDADYSRRLATLRAVRDATARYGGDVERRSEEAWSALAAAQCRSPAVVRALIAYPSIGPALLRSLHALTAPGGASDARTVLDPGHALAALAAAAVVATGLPARVGVTLYDRRIGLPGLGAVGFPGSGSDPFPELPDGTWAAVEGGPSGARITVGGRRVALSAAPWQGLRVLVPAADPTVSTGGGLVLDDIDPYCAPVGGRCGRLSDAAWHRWRQVSDGGWELLRAEHAEVAAEAAVVLRALVPLTGPPGGSRSGSSKETFGATALTMPATAHDMALALSHELQHNKLSALLHLFDLLAERPGELFYAPWREDPRPLIGLLHGAYAHLGVARFWHRRLSCGRLEGAARHEAEVRFARWRDGAAEAVGTLLTCGRLTDIGVRFVTGMRDALDALGRVPVRPAAAAESAAVAAEHRRRWDARHGAPTRAGLLG